MVQASVADRHDQLGRLLAALRWLEMKNIIYSYGYCYFCVALPLFGKTALAAESTLSQFPCQLSDSFVSTQVSVISDAGDPGCAEFSHGNDLETGVIKQ
jgi:hypothetical protein